MSWVGRLDRSIQCWEWAGGIWVKGFLLENMASDKVWSGVEKSVGNGIIRCDEPKWKNGLIKCDITGNDNFVGGKVKAAKSVVHQADSEGLVFKSKPKVKSKLKPKAVVRVLLSNENVKCKRILSKEAKSKENSKVKLLKAKMIQYSDSELATDEVEFDS
ncbi:hypothetical protein Tco_0369225 [Tanacetum coccineum]